MAPVLPPPEGQPGQPVDVVDCAWAAQEQGPHNAIPASAGDAPWLDALAGIGWLVSVNKPLYPVYLWWIAPSGLWISLALLASTPVFVLAAQRMRSGHVAWRLAMTIVALLDTVLATKIFGPSGGGAYFLVPCLVLTLLAFRPSERGWSRALLLLIAGVALVPGAFYGTPIHTYSVDELARIASLNYLSMVGITIYIGWRLAAALSANRH